MLLSDFVITGKLRAAFTNDIRVCWPLMLDCAVLPVRIYRQM